MADGTAHYAEKIDDTQHYQTLLILFVVGNGHGDSSSNPGREWLHFTYH